MVSSRGCVLSVCTLVQAEHVNLILGAQKGADPLVWSLHEVPEIGAAFVSAGSRVVLFGASLRVEMPAALEGGR